jgi:hypothetical protein
VHVHEKRPTRHDLRLPVAARQHAPLRLLRHGADSANRRYGRGTRKDPTDSRYHGGAGLAAKGERAGSVMRQDPDSYWLKLELAHPADCSDAIGPSRRQSRKLRF